MHQSAQSEVQRVYLDSKQGPPKGLNDAGHAESSGLPNAFFSQCLMALILQDPAFQLQSGAVWCSNHKVHVWE